MQFTRNFGVGEMLLEHIFCSGFSGQVLTDARLLVPVPRFRWATEDKTFKTCRGFNCFWKPLQPSCNASSDELMPRSPKLNWTFSSYFVPTAFEQRWGPLLHGVALTAWWWRPVKAITRMFNQQVAALGLQPAGSRCIAMHVRHGDTCPRKRTGTRVCTPFRVYMRFAEGFRRQYGYTKIFLATDDGHVLDEVSAYPQFNISYFTDFDRKKYDSPNGVFIERTGIHRFGNAFYDAIRDIHAASLCEAFIGSFDASMSHLMFYRMVYRLGIVPPFASVDAKFCVKRMDYACCLAGLMAKSKPMCTKFRRWHAKGCVTR